PPTRRQPHKEVTGGYRWDTTAANRGKDAPIKEKDDHCDALRYAVISPRHLWRKQIMLGA
ncbi:hypothetical protein BT094_11640, partial [Corynebacterium diphtheriae]